MGIIDGRPIIGKETGLSLSVVALLIGTFWVWTGYENSKDEKYQKKFDIMMDHIQDVTKLSNQNALLIQLHMSRPDLHDGLKEEIEKIKKH